MPHNYRIRPYGEVWRIEEWAGTGWFHWPESYLTHENAGDALFKRKGIRVDPETAPLKCSECGETVGADAPRPWACSDRCYADALGIDPVTG